MSKLRNYIAKKQKGWGKYVQLLTYTYTTPVHNSTNITTFSLVLYLHSPGPTTVSQAGSGTTDSYI